MAVKSLLLQSCYMVGQTELPKFRRHKDDRSMFDIPGRFPLNHAYTEVHVQTHQGALPSCGTQTACGI